MSQHCSIAITVALLGSSHWIQLKWNAMKCSMRAQKMLYQTTSKFYILLNVYLNEATKRWGLFLEGLWLFSFTCHFCNWLMSYQKCIHSTAPHLITVHFKSWNRNSSAISLCVCGQPNMFSFQTLINQVTYTRIRQPRIESNKKAHACVREYCTTQDLRTPRK